MLSKWVNCVEGWFSVGDIGFADKLLGLLITEVLSIRILGKSRGQIKIKAWGSWRLKLAGD
jgi:hypothetical protein